MFFLILDVYNDFLGNNKANCYLRKPHKCIQKSLTKASHYLVQKLQRAALPPNKYRRFDITLRVGGGAGARGRGGEHDKKMKEFNEKYVKGCGWEWETIDELETKTESDK